MAEYLYEREILAEGCWDIDNPNRVDLEGNQIHLASEVADALPGKMFQMICDGPVCKFIFSQALTAQEEATLTTTVNNHKQNL
jgi:hypothetical protein